VYLKKYLLMGQGDLMEYLMDLLAEELGKSASLTYKHTLR
jgi:Gamma tubulin complex component C-terminal